MSASVDVDVVNNTANEQFEVTESGQLATLTYSVDDGKLYLLHTEVPKALAGRRYGSALAQTALEYAKREHLRVVPWCPFVLAYLRRHPEYNSLVEDE